MVRNCSKCKTVYDTEARGAHRWYCPDCQRADARAYRQRKREAAGISDEPPLLKVAGFVTEADPDAVRQWAGWQAPLDRGTMEMFRAGDFVTGTIVYTIDQRARRKGQPCVIVTNPYGGQTVAPLDEYLRARGI